MKKILSFLMAVLLISAICISIVGCPDRAMAPKEDKPAAAPAK